MLSDDSAFLKWAQETEKDFRRIMGYQHLWVLEAKLQELRELQQGRTQHPATTQTEIPAATLLTKEAAY